MIQLPEELEAIKAAGLRAQRIAEDERMARRRYRNQRHAVLRPLHPAGFVVPMQACHFMGPAVHWGTFPQFMQQPAVPRCSDGAPMVAVWNGFGNNGWITPVCVPSAVPEPSDPDPLEEVVQVTDLGDQLLDTFDDFLALDLEVS